VSKVGEKRTKNKEIGTKFVKNAKMKFSFVYTVGEMGRGKKLFTENTGFGERGVVHKRRST